MTNSEQLCCSRQETAELLGLGVSTVDLLIRRRALRSVRIGRLTKIPRTEIDRFVRKGGTLVVWPKKQNGKTTRQIVTPEMKKALATSDLAEPRKRERA
jgi:excisionase family DNA binding protein